jgi:hypothetical protein
MRRILRRSALPALLAAVVVAAAPAHAARYQYDGHIGEMGPGGGEFHGGTGDGQLRNPTKIGLDGSDNLYVLDIGNQRVSKFNRSGRFVSHWPVGSSPQGLAVDAGGDVFVSHFDGTIRKFDASGSQLALWSSSDPSRESYGDLAVSASGDIFALRARTAAGLFIDRIAADGTRIDSWAINERAVALATDAGGDVYVVDGVPAQRDDQPAPTQVRKFSAAGAELTSWTVAGVNGAVDIGLDHDGNVYITTSRYSPPDRDWALPNIQMFTPSGELVERWGAKSDGQSETYGVGVLYDPDGVVGDSAGHLFVADSTSDRVLRFAPTGGGGGNGSPADPTAGVSSVCIELRGGVRKRTKAVPGGGEVLQTVSQSSDPSLPIKVTAGARRGAKIASAVFKVNKKVVTSTGTTANIPVGALKLGKRNTVSSDLTLTDGRKITVNEIIVVLKCALPPVTCQRVSGGTRLKCSSSMPRRARTVKVTVAGPNGATANGSAKVKLRKDGQKGEYSMTMKPNATLPPGKYLYKHVATTTRQGEKLLATRILTLK